MAGANMNTALSFVNGTVQTQQNAFAQNLGCAVSSDESSTGFETYMKTSVAASEEQTNYRNAEKTAGTVERVKYSGTISEETVAHQKQKVETQGEAKDILSADGTEKPDRSANTEFSQKMQEFSGESDETVGLPENLKEVLAEIEEQLKQKILEGFDITDDELKEALEVLSINIYDLLQTDNLKELAVYISGEESLVSLVTNEDMYQAYKEAMTGMKEIGNVLRDKLSLTPEELQEIMNQLKSITLENQSKVVDPVNTGEILSQQVITENAEQSDASAKSAGEAKQPEILVEVSKAMETAEKENAGEKTVFQENSSIQLEGKEAKTTTEDSAGHQQKDFASASDGAEKKTAANSQENSAVQTNTSYSTVVSENQIRTVAKTQQTNFEGIVRQIVEQIKVEIKPDVSSMELHLTPENLGKVNLHVTSKEGAITAQLFVQNETVKAMIEGQLMVLREAMNEQGVKVEAVEVAVEAEQFGRSLEQNSEQQREEAQKQGKLYRHRDINLLAGLDEESMNEEELLRVHIMRESGNSVDMNV